MEPKLCPVSLANILKPLRDEFTALAENRGLRLKVRSTRACVVSDSHWLRRIIQNFLSNAVRYTNSGGILLGCRQRGDKLWIEVWDTGPGIPEDKFKEIFGEFKRLNNGRQDSKGLGLGLAIVDRMARQMGHEVQVLSRTGRGTCFRLIVPLTDEPVEERTLVRTGAQAASFEGVRTFCIDNDAEVLEGMKALLTSWQCDLFAASDEHEAMTLETAPQIMLADYQLDGDITGLDVMKAVREKFPEADIPGILITADPREQVADKARAEGFHYLAKPLRPASLRALMRRLIRPE